MNQIEMSYTIADIKHVIEKFNQSRPDACIITYGQIFRQDGDEGIKRLTGWIRALTEDRRHIAKMAKNPEWTEGELNALRSLYQSRTNQIADCEKAIIMLEQLIIYRMEIEERIDLYASRNSAGAFDVELPF